MRLEPIEKPPNLMMRIAYWMARRQLGKVPSAFKVLYGRAPALATLAWRMQQTVEKKLAIDEELRLLVLTQASQQNGCAFCADLHEAQAVQAKLGLEKFRALPEFRESPLFSGRERAALAWTEEITKTRNASDATFAALRKHFDERQIVELTWLNALSNYYNLMAVPLGLESDDLLQHALRRAA